MHADTYVYMCVYVCVCGVQINSNLSEAAGSASGLTAQQEVFLKQQAKVARGKFVDVSKPYAQQVRGERRLTRFSRGLSEIGAVT